MFCWLESKLFQDVFLPAQQVKNLFLTIIVTFLKFVMTRHINHIVRDFSLANKDLMNLTHKLKISSLEIFLWLMIKLNGDNHFILMYDQYHQT